MVPGYHHSSGGMLDTMVGPYPQYMLILVIQHIMVYSTYSMYRGYTVCIWIHVMHVIPLLGMYSYHGIRGHGAGMMVWRYHPSHVATRIPHDEVLRVYGIMV